AEDQEALIVRFVNLTSQDQPVRVRLGTAQLGVTVTGAEQVNLREHRVNPLEVVEGTVTLTARPSEIVTVALQVRPKPVEPLLQQGSAQDDSALEDSEGDPR
ncbi:MAG: alpha-mannosidase, partial [Deinococcus sp.]|nr:alpha-mannosidase [Deinococcus sp.]